MNFKLENIGKIKSASIELNGLTVVAGSNNSGKSTLGKVVYSLINSSFKNEKTLEKFHLNRIDKGVRGFNRRSHSAFLRINKEEKIEILSRKFVSDTFLNDKESLLNHLNERISKLEDLVKEKEDAGLRRHSYKRALMELVSLTTLVESEVTLTDESFQRFDNFLSSCTDGSLRLVQKNKTCTVEMLENESSIISYTSTKEGDINLNVSNDIKIPRKAIFIESPLVLNWFSNLNLHADLSWKSLNSIDIEYAIYNVQLAWLLSSRSIEDVEPNPLVEEAVKSITAIAGGKLIEVEDEEKFLYESMNGTYPMRNTAMGIKSFLLLAKLLSNKHIDDQTVLILDEPEVHLHPDWQVRFAEVLVKLVENIGLNILISSHSPFFIEAIQKYSEKYKLESSLNLYLAEEKGNQVEIVNYNNSPSVIYDSLAKAFDILDSI